MVLGVFLRELVRGLRFGLAGQGISGPADVIDLGEAPWMLALWMHSEAPKRVSRAGQTVIEMPVREMLRQAAGGASPPWPPSEWRRLLLEARELQSDEVYISAVPAHVGLDTQVPIVVTAEAPGL